MKIIKITSFEDGSRPSLQDWNHKELPVGYAWCPDEFVKVFYSTSPAGFVNISVRNNSVSAMEINESALNAYIEALDKERAEREAVNEDAS